MKTVEMSNPKNARFWVYWNGWVKLTLAPGKYVEMRDCRATDEGFSETFEYYYHDGDGVVSRVRNRSADCDGRHEYHAEHFCPLENLAERNMGEDHDQPENRGIFAPAWEKVTSGQRDQFAEAMGY